MVALGLLLTCNACRSQLEKSPNVQCSIEYLAESTKEDPLTRIIIFRPDTGEKLATFPDDFLGFKVESEKLRGDHYCFSADVTSNGRYVVFMSALWQVRAAIFCYDTEERKLHFISDGSDYRLISDDVILIEDASYFSSIGHEWYDAVYTLDGSLILKGPLKYKDYD